MGTFKFPIDGLTKDTITLNQPAKLESQGDQLESRTIYAAVHVVANPLEASASNVAATVDWEATARFRERMWSMGLGVAEAMDTAQRGMGMDWESVKKLLTRTMKDAKAVGGAVVSGVATDQLPKGSHTLESIKDAYLEQLEFTVATGAIPVIMCSRELASVARNSEDYLYLYSQLIEQSDSKVVLHWLGSMFDPQLEGYWGGNNYLETRDTVLNLIKSHSDKIEGVKMSLLNEQHEIDFRSQLPSNVKMFTGDDFNYVRLIKGDGKHFSHALLGAFAAISKYASAAIRDLDAGDEAKYLKILGPTETLSREIFKAPTYYYKTGIVWLAYLSGLQDHFYMVGGLQSGRSIRDLTELFILGNEIGLFPDPDLALYRLKLMFESSGIRI